MELPDLKLLQAAIVLSEVRNYSRAARRLGIQQPTLTKRIVELEDFVGFRLFLRSTQYVEPTDACRRLVQEAKESVFHAERAIQLARATEKGAQAVLHLGKSQYIDPYFVSMLTSVSLPLFPNFHLSLSTLSSQELELEVLLGKLDMAIIAGASEDQNITQIEIARTPFYIVLPDSIPLAKEFEITLKQLEGRRWSLFERNIHPILYDAVLRVAAEDGISPVSMNNVATAEEAAQLLYAGISEVAFLTRAGAWRVARNGLTMRHSFQPPEAVSIAPSGLDTTNSCLPMCGRTLAPTQPAIPPSWKCLGFSHRPAQMVWPSRERRSNRYRADSRERRPLPRRPVCCGILDTLRPHSSQG